MDEIEWPDLFGLYETVLRRGQGETGFAVQLHKLLSDFTKFSNSYLRESGE